MEASAVSLPARPVRRVRQRSRVRGGVVWIAILGVLLAGVVALNVAVLRLNMRYDKLGRTKVDLVAQNAALSSQIARSAGTDRIQSLARKNWQLIPATSDMTRYIQLVP